MDGSMNKQEILQSLVTDKMIHESVGSDLTDSARCSSGTNPEAVKELKHECLMDNSAQLGMNDEIQHEKMEKGFIEPSSRTISNLIVMAPQEDNFDKYDLFQTNPRPYSPDHQEFINQETTTPAVEQEIMDVVIKEEKTEDISKKEIHDKQVRRKIQNCEGYIDLEDDQLDKTHKTEAEPVIMKNKTSEDRLQELLIKSKSSAAGLDWTSSPRKSSEDAYNMVDECGSKIANNLVSRIRAQTEQILLELESTNNIDERDTDSATPCQELDTSVTTKQKHSATKPHLCIECGKTFTQKQHLMVHMLTHSGEKPHGCKQCGKFFSQSGNLKKHMLTHSAYKPHLCKQCGKFFSLPEHLERHMKSHAEEKPFQFIECGNEFTQIQGGLVEHMLTHSGKKSYQCKQCGKFFSQSGNLKQHMTSHTEEKPFQCRECGNEFKQKRSLDVHMLTHSNYKPHECKQCGQLFSQCGSLKRHMLIHSGDKPHECKQCGKFFSQSGHLKRHILTHSDDKPLECIQCGKFFSHPGNLKKHMITHLGDKPHECKQCGKFFSRSVNLQQHMLTHSGDKPHECKQCGKFFSLSGNLKRHMKSHAKEESN